MLNLYFDLRYIFRDFKVVVRLVIVFVLDFNFFNWLYIFIRLFIVVVLLVVMLFRFVRLVFLFVEYVDRILYRVEFDKGIKFVLE